MMSSNVKEDMQWFAYWGALLVKSKIPKSLHRELLRQGEKLKKDEASRYNKHLAGVIKDEFIFKNFQSWFMPKFMPSLLSYENIFETDWKESATHIASPFYVEECELWINYQKCREFNPRHYHVGDLSFVIYLQIPEELKQENQKTKELHNSQGTGAIQFHYGEHMPFSLHSLQELPEEGDMYIFPSWLQHSVSPFFVDVERISVAGNITLTKS